MRDADGTLRIRPEVREVFKNNDARSVFESPIREVPGVMPEHFVHEAVHLAGHR